jgi:hypothetical protein
MRPNSRVDRHSSSKLIGDRISKAPIMAVRLADATIYAIMPGARVSVVSHHRDKAIVSIDGRLYRCLTDELMTCSRSALLSTHIRPRQ